VKVDMWECVRRSVRCACACAWEEGTKGLRQVVADARRRRRSERGIAGQEHLSQHPINCGSCTSCTSLRKSRGRRRRRRQEGLWMGWKGGGGGRSRLFSRIARDTLVIIISHAPHRRDEPGAAAL